METLQTMSYVLTSWDSDHQSSSCILQPLQFHYLTDWESTVQRVKRIQFRCDQSMNQSLKCISVQEFADLPDLLVHAHSLIKAHYPVGHHSKEETFLELTPLMQTHCEQSER